MPRLEGRGFAVRAFQDLILTNRIALGAQLPRQAATLPSIHHAECEVRPQGVGLGLLLGELGRPGEDLVLALAHGAPRVPHVRHDNLELLQRLVPVFLRELFQIALVQLQVRDVILVLQGLIFPGPVLVYEAFELLRIFHEQVPFAFVRLGQSDEGRGSPLVGSHQDLPLHALGLHVVAQEELQPVLLAAGVSRREQQVARRGRLDGDGLRVEVPDHD
mmetsp:Transcript_3834/g.10192  ORF Transcript_3834/g.10192 Transcript_3834/m.10192 type:complete len:218 (-) Transcript_3834:153-806(-)